MRGSSRCRKPAVSTPHPHPKQHTISCSVKLHPACNFIWRTKSVQPVLSVAAFTLGSIVDVDLTHTNHRHQHDFHWRFGIKRLADPKLTVAVFSSGQGHSYWYICSVHVKTRSGKMLENLTWTSVCPCVCCDYLHKNVGRCQRGTMETLIRSRVCLGIVIKHTCSHIQRQGHKSTQFFFLLFLLLCNSYSLAPNMKPVDRYTHNAYKEIWYVYFSACLLKSDLTWTVHLQAVLWEHNNDSRISF